MRTINFVMSPFKFGDIWEKDGKYYVVRGWNGAQYTDCYMCNYFGMRLTDHVYYITVDFKTKAILTVEVKCGKIS